jgi:hypothetical protein
MNESNESIKDETDPKKPTKGRKGRSNNQRGQKEKEKAKNALQNEGGNEVDTPAVIEEPKNLKQKILKWMEHNAYVTTMIVLTVLALFMIDMVIIIEFTIQMHES